MGSGKRAAEAIEAVAVDDADALAAKKAAKRAKKAAAAATAEPVAEEDDEAAALAAKKAAKKAKKAAAAAEPEEDAEAAALAAKKAAKKAKKAAAAAAAAEAEAEEEDPVAAKKAKKAKKAAAEEEEEAPALKKAKSPKVEAAPAPKVAEPVKAAAAEEEEWKDNTYKCCDCNEDWVDTIDDQTFRYDKGFAETPKRCKDCRWAKKVRMEGGDPTAKGKGKGKKGNKEFEVFVGGLPFSTTEDVLHKDFAECGEIANFRMPLNDEGTARGIAFIEYKDKEGVEKALKFNETDYGGRTLSVRMSGDDKGKGKGKDGKDKGKGKGKDGKDKGKGKKGKKGKASSEAFAKNTGAMVESTGKKAVFADSDDE